MAKKKRLIIPVFIPFGGCPEKCVFCDQPGITASPPAPSVPEVRGTIEKYLATWRGTGRREVAFYGGSFTALKAELQRRYLQAAAPYIEDGSVDALRVSTRPDCVDGEGLKLLKEFGVDTVELGAQSMSAEVLRLAGRGHGPGATVASSKLVKAFGMSLGIQTMPGLPGDTADGAVETAREITSLGPDFVRIYPALVLKDTPLHRMYLEGSYSAWGLGEMVRVCSEISGVYQEAGIPVIRMGLQPTRELAERLVAGPFHPAFRDLVSSYTRSGVAEPGFAG